MTNILKILIIGTRFAPIPAFEGGAIEMLTDVFLNYNSHTDIKEKYEFVVYSRFSEKIDNTLLKNYKNTEFRYIKQNNLRYKLNRIVFGVMRKFIKNKVGDEFVRAIYADLKKRKELEKYDKIIVHNNINNIEYIKQNIKGKHILHLHNDYLNIDTPNAINIVNSLDEIWCVSNFIKLRVDEVIKNDKTKVLYNCVNINYFRKQVSKKEKEELYDLYKMNKEDFVVLYTGRIMKEKGVEELIKAFCTYFTNIKNAKLLIVGQPNDVNYEYYTNLKEKYSSYDKISFLGQKSHEELSRLYNICSVQVIPSMCNEAFGLTVIEGMAAGTPIIVSDSGGIPEIVSNNCALIVKRDNIIKELVDAFDFMYKNIKSKNIIDMVNNTKNRVLDFSIEKYCETINEYLKK